MTGKRTGRNGEGAAGRFAVERQAPASLQLPDGPARKGNAGYAVAGGTNEYGSEPAGRIAAKRQAALSSRPETGRRGEEAAALHLQRLGYRVLHRNWRCRLGELDIVAEHDGTLVFVEVRTRRGSSRFGSAVESVDARKRRRLAAVAQVYLAANGRTNVPIRFDVVACTLGRDDRLQVEHLMGVME